MQTFYHLLVNALIVATKNNFVWFALTYWIYLQTNSVVSTSILGGSYMLITAGSGFLLGSLVDHYTKKHVIAGSSIATLVFFLLGFLVYNVAPQAAFTSVGSVMLWVLVALLLLGSIAGNVLNIAIPTLVTHLVPQKNHDKANGMFGTVMGISFAITSVASGIVLAFAGMWWVLFLAIFFTLVSILHIILISIPEKKVIHVGQPPAKKVDVRGTIHAIQAIPGLFALIFFTTFNNFLGGAFMALMDAYGLTLVSVQVWGSMWGALSLGFILGGMIIAKKGLGKNPLINLFRINLITWTVCIFFTVQPSIILLMIGCFIWITLVPFIEATEQTIIQKVVPAERQGRVFGFAHSVEQAASPVTAFFIGPIAQYIFIPFMTTGAGVELIGGWYGVGIGRGIGLVFSITGIIGLIVTLVAMRSNAYKMLFKRYSS